MRGTTLEIAALVLCGLLGAWLALAWRGQRERARGRANQARGKRGERDAERVLRAHGYRIRGQQVPASYTITVDGVAQQVELVLDFVVERDGEELVAEVKTSTSRAPQLSRAETRRQLLEYQLATRTRRALLVDPDACSVIEVAFPLAAEPSRSPSAWRTFAVLALLAALVVWRWRSL